MAYDNGQSSSWRKKRNSIVIEQQVIEPQQILVEGERQAMVQSNRSIEQDKEVGTVEESAQHKKDAREFGGPEEDHRIKGVGYVVRECDGLVSNNCDAESEGCDSWLKRIGFIVLRGYQLDGCGQCIFVRVKEIDVYLDVGLRQSLPELDTSDDKSVVPENHMSNSPIWHMNRFWEDNMLEDWRVLESSVAV
ncbi:hypothetical protein V6N12_067856 [Hibiscus sabdariffa]|uniref:Uncharacterized protein n=1 Tax=Hibiscus sabdariffa TaxID=183260 RepID=A0ABR2FNC8_9ROSI